MTGPTPAPVSMTPADHLADAGHVAALAGAALRLFHGVPCTGPTAEGLHAVLRELAEAADSHRNALDAAAPTEPGAD